MRSIHFIAFSAAALIVTNAVTRSAHSEQAPQPAPEIARITALAGKFDGEAVFTANGETKKFVLHHTSRVIAGGFGLAVHEEADIPGVGHYEAENLIGWDAGKKQLHLLSVTNDPYTHDHAGRWTDPTHVTLRYEGLQDGKKLVEVIPMEVPSANQYRFQSTLTVAGQTPQKFEATMKRVGDLSSR